MPAVSCCKKCITSCNVMSRLSGVAIYSMQSGLLLGYYNLEGWLRYKPSFLEMDWWRYSHKSKHLVICIHPIVLALSHWYICRSDLLSLLETLNFSRIWGLFLIIWLKFYCYPKFRFWHSWHKCFFVVSLSFCATCMLFCEARNWGWVSFWCLSLFPDNGMKLWLGIWLQHPFVIFLEKYFYERLQLIYCCLFDLLEEMNKDLSPALVQGIKFLDCLVSSFPLLPLPWHEI